MKEKELKITEIDQLSDKIHEIWGNISMHDMGKMEDIWKDDVCIEFIKKLKNVDNTIVKIIEELDNLKDCWQTSQELETGQEE